MKQNKYDDQTFFDLYKNMDRSIKGLEGAGEWHALKNILPSFDGKNVLDLGCGFGWHCRYAIENGAKTVTGVDLSDRMLHKAKEINDLPGITYIRSALEDITFEEQEFHCVISSLTFHYIKDFDLLCMHINRWLKPVVVLYFLLSIRYSLQDPTKTGSTMQREISYTGPWTITLKKENGKRISCITM